MRTLTQRTVLFWAAALQAQVSSHTGAIQGFVTDSQKAAVPGARVTAVQHDTNDRRGAVANERGEFVLANLPIGPYALTAEAPGFAKIEIEEALVSVGQTLFQHFNLKLETVAEKMEVVEQANALQANATSQSTAMGYERMEEAPAQGRNYLNFVLVAPGITPSSGSSAGRSPAATWNAANDSGFVAGGMRGRNNSVSIDGTDNRDETTGTTRVSVPLEMIQELRVAGTAVSADFGGAAGGLVNVVTRSGSNAWHGHGEFMFQNEALNARNPEFQISGRPRLRRWQPGASGSGPLRRDRTFVAFAFESYNEDCDEWSEAPTGFAARDLPLHRGTFRAGEKDQQYSIKFQHIFNAKHTATARYAFSWGRVNNGVQGIEDFSDYSARGSSNLRDHSFVGGVTSVLSPSLVNLFTVQIAHRDAELRPNSTVPMVQIPGVLTFGQGYRLNQQRREDHYEAVDAVSMTAGRHLFTIGGSIHTVPMEADLADRFGGILVYPDMAAYQRQQFLWRIQAFGNSRTSLHTIPMGVWFQDRWQVRPGLSVEGILESGTLRSRRVWLPVGGARARVGARRQNNEGPDPWRAHQIQGSNSSLYAGSAHCRQRARFLCDLFNDGWGNCNRPHTARSRDTSGSARQHTRLSLGQLLTPQS